MTKICKIYNFTDFCMLFLGYKNYYPNVAILYTKKGMRLVDELEDLYNSHLLAEDILTRQVLKIAIEQTKLKGREMQNRGDMTYSIMTEKQKQLLGAPSNRPKRNFIEES